MTQKQPPKVPNQEQADEARLNEVLARIEGEYFLDYALFTGSMREYTVRSLENRFNQGDPVDLQDWRNFWPIRWFFRRQQPSSDYHRRMFMLAVFREQYMAYEDLEAFLDGFLANRDQPTTVPLTRIMLYKPGNVRLDRVFERFGIANGDELFERLDLQTWVPEEWAATFPDIDLPRALRRACWFFVADCRRTQKKEAVSAFNKLKHGLMFIPSARRFRNEWLDAPGILIQSEQDQPGVIQNPVTVYQIPSSDEMIGARLEAVHFVETGLRLIAVLYVIKRYPEVPKRRGLEGLAAFRHPFMQDVMDIASQLSNKPWEPKA